MRRSWIWLFVPLLVACGASSSSTSAVAATAGPPRTGPPVDLIALVPENASVVLHANLNAVRQDAGRYDRVAAELAATLGLAHESAVVRALLDRTEDAVGTMVPAGDGSTQEGMLLLSGNYSDADFEQALSIAASRHGSSPGGAEPGTDGRRVVPLGNATLVQLDTWTWAIAQGPTVRSHLLQVPLRGSRVFTRDLIPFGPRIGLPEGATEAWADQRSQVGIDMFGLVMAGENPQMVSNFVATVRRHLGL